MARSWSWGASPVGWTTVTMRCCASRVRAVPLSRGDVPLGGVPPGVRQSAARAAERGLGIRAHPALGGDHAAEPCGGRLAGLSRASGSSGCRRRARRVRNWEARGTGPDGLRVAGPAPGAVMRGRNRRRCTSASRPCACRRSRRIASAWRNRPASGTGTRCATWRNWPRLARLGSPPAGRQNAGHAGVGPPARACGGTCRGSAKAAS